MITSILMAIGMAIGILVKALLPSGGVTSQGKGGGDGKPENVKEWIRNKLKALALLLGRSGAKVTEALPGITGMIISWILHRTKEVIGWVLKNLWVLVVGVRWFLYLQMITRK